MKLKPCPRCGSERIEISTYLYPCKVEEYNVILTMIHCKDCGCAITRCDDKEAYDAWNDRGEENE